MSVTAPTAPSGSPDAIAPTHKRRRPPVLPYWFLLPAALVIGLALGYPLIRLLVMSFQEYGLAQQFGQPPDWVGVDNYVNLVSDPYLWTVVVRSVVFCLVTAGATMILGISVAMLMARLAAAIRLTLQVCLLLAWSMPWVASLAVWQWMFDTQYGVINWVGVNVLGVDSLTGHSWLINPLSFFFVASLMIVWYSIPFVAFTVYAALTQVPSDAIEAAQIDGAGGWARFRFIVLPMIRPVLLLVGLLQIIWDLKVFTQIFFLQDAGGVTRETNLLGTYIYRLGIGEGQFGLAAAASWFILVLTVSLSFYYIRMLLRQEEP